MTIPSSVTSIGESVFIRCKNLTDVTVPSSVTSIGGAAFGGTPWLEKIAREQGGFGIINGILLDYVGSGGNVKIPKEVTSIGGHAFLGCYNMTSVTIPDSVTSIGERAFEGCENLVDIYYGGSEEQGAELGLLDEDMFETTPNIHYNIQYKRNGPLENSGAAPIIPIVLIVMAAAVCVLFIMKESFASKKRTSAVPAQTAPLNSAPSQTPAPASFCPKCGAAVTGAGRFCDSCGAALD